LRFQKQTLEQAVADQRKELAAKEDAFAAEHKGLEDRRAALQDEVGQLVMEQAQWAQELKTLRETHRVESRRYEALKAEIAKAEAAAERVRALDRDVATREEAVARLTAEHVELVAAVEDSRGTIDALAAAKREHAETQARLEERSVA